MIFTHSSKFNLVKLAGCKNQEQFRSSQIVEIEFALK
jgi:hypothetical protein